MGNARSGASQFGRAGKTIAELNRAVGNVAQITTEIAASAHERSRTIEEVNQAVASMDQTTQQNAALVQQMAAAESLSAQARDLHATAGFFRLGTSDPSTF